MPPSTQQFPFPHYLILQEQSVVGGLWVVLLVVCWWFVGGLLVVLSLTKGMLTVNSSSSLIIG